jgi:hypothetical protein
VANAEGCDVLDDSNLGVMICDGMICDVMCLMGFDQSQSVISVETKSCDRPNLEITKNHPRFTVR